MSEAVLLGEPKTDVVCNSILVGSCPSSRNRQQNPRVSSQNTPSFIPKGSGTHEWSLADYGRFGVGILVRRKGPMTTLTWVLSHVLS